MAGECVCRTCAYWEDMPHGKGLCGVATLFSSKESLMVARPQSHDELRFEPGGAWLETDPEFGCDSWESEVFDDEE